MRKHRRSAMTPRPVERHPPNGRLPSSGPPRRYRHAPRLSGRAHRDGRVADACHACERAPRLSRPHRLAQFGEQRVAAPRRPRRSALRLVDERAKACVDGRRAPELPGKAHDLAVDPVDLGRAFRSQIIGHRRTRERIDLEHLPAEPREQRVRHAQHPRHPRGRQRREPGGTNLRRRQHAQRLGLRERETAPIAARREFLLQRPVRERVDRVVEIEQQLRPLNRAHVLARHERQPRALERGREAAQRGRGLGLQRARRALMESALAARDDVERHHAGKHRRAGQRGAQHVRVAHAVLKTDDDRAGPRDACERRADGGRRRRLHRDEHEFGGGERRIRRRERNRGWRHAHVAAAIIGQREPVRAQLVADPRAADQRDIRAAREQPAAEIAADRARAIDADRRHRARRGSDARVARAHTHRPDAPLDRVAHVAAQAGEERNLGDDEQRADDEPDQVVDERGLAAFEVMADELDHPADEKEPEPRAEPERGRLRGKRAAGPEAQREQRGHRDAEAQVEPQIEKRRRERDERRGRERECAPCAERRPRQQHRHRDDDHRNADEMRRNVACVAVIGRVLRELVDQGPHRVSSRCE
ncbi:hypothetical protein BURPS1710b_1091 [Burkholderia pseudomallei 1710b]|uniref:Uncharacterized protein n=1 Tax=Burkholderia pseudomallei (strain 1710b) TaxID=320372 RepID=Q3JVA1_BURP1|nr:hypothetical protein BURPS1710b_1091 [Burkholderia pseudomallei 1710b]